ncbi:hypothetical protein BI49514_02268 [Brevibacterium iodinum ATCC 49514]|uniref:Uncharacterized protein n=1 Tax=Brevibacterium iodinum ATCC 49514 TaxID=1255616 RepID=A0A2H1JQY6_9MICO|nr:hypothetical protein BI49514_02268 [Brevibacterium iodinum ATCC 49514]SUW13911.1 Uncharacterised protein [Brevibacterium iodinum]
MMALCSAHSSAAHHGRSRHSDGLPGQGLATKRHLLEVENTLPQKLF